MCRLCLHISTSIPPSLTSQTLCNHCQNTTEVRTITYTRYIQVRCNTLKFHVVVKTVKNVSYFCVLGRFHQL